VENEAQVGRTEVVLIAYRPPEHELGAKTIDFSNASIDERWRAGEEDMARAVATLREGRATRDESGFAFYDCRRPGRARAQAARVVNGQRFALRAPNDAGKAKSLALSPAPLCR
jgi:hypothetical protein